MLPASHPAHSRQMWQRARRAPTPRRLLKLSSIWTSAIRLIGLGLAPVVPAHAGTHIPEAAVMGPRNGTPATRASRGAPRADDSIWADESVSFARRRGSLFDIGPTRQGDDVLEGLEVDGFVVARGPAGLEIGERGFEGARDAKDQGGRVSDHREAEAVELVRRQDWRASATLDHIGELRHTLKRPPDLRQLLE